MLSFVQRILEGINLVLESVSVSCVVQRVGYKCLLAHVGSSIAEADWEVD